MTSGKRFFLAHWPILLILLLSAFLLFFRLNRDLLADWDECVYSVHAVEMKQTGNVIANQWNGTVDFLKPPLYTWLLQIPYLFGVNEFTTRILSVIFALLLMVTLYSFCHRYFNAPTAIFAVLLLLTSELFIIVSRRANTDMGFALFVFSAFYLWRLSSEKRRYAYFSGICFGLAVLIKGLGVLPYFFAIFISLFFEPRRNRFIDFGIVIGIFLLTIAPWHIAAYLIYGDQFLRDYIYEGVLKRAKYPLESHEGPWYKYLSQLKRMMFPWIYLGIVFPLTFVRNMLSDPLLELWKREKLVITVLLLTLIPLFFISKMQTKLAWYALPIYPFLVVYLSHNIDLVLRSLTRRTIAYIAVALLIGAQAFVTIVHETHLTASQREINPRNEMLLRSSALPGKDLHYLVEPGRREDLLGLPAEQRHSNTLLFGGNPCALHYSGKHLKYYYDVKEFSRSVEGENGLFLMDNSDSPSIAADRMKIIVKNESYTLFEPRLR